MKFVNFITYLVTIRLINVIYYKSDDDIIFIDPECTPQASNFSSDGRKCLHIGGTVPMSGGWPGGQGCLPAILMALQDVNKKMDLLPGYYLRFHYNDSKCNPGLGTRVLYDLLYNKPTKIALLSGCSAVSTTMGESAAMWNLIVLSYGASSPALSNRKRFPTFFRTHPSQALHNPTRVVLFKKYGWKRIAILQELQELFTSTAEDLEHRLKMAGMEVMTRQSFISDPVDAVKNLKRQDARIIVGIFYDNYAQQVFCEVYKHKLYGKKYVWFILGWYADNWFEDAEKNTNCTTEQLVLALNNHFTIESLMLNQDDTVTVSGMTANTFLSKLKSHFKARNIEPSTVSGLAEAPLAYDAVWALAFALNKTMRKLETRPGPRIYMENFTYTDEYIRNLVYQSMSDTKFFGVSGLLTFTDSGDRIAWTMLEQMINRTYRKLAFYHQYDENLTWLKNATWEGSGPPSDRTTILKKMMVISHKLFVGICVGCFLCILLCVSCLAFNRFFRNRKIISQSAPYFNDMMLVGNVMCLVAAMMFGLDGRLFPLYYEKICRGRLWLLSLGFSLAYGSLFTKVLKVQALKAAIKKDNKTISQLIKHRHKQVVDFIVSKKGSGIEINFLVEPSDNWKYNLCVPTFLALDILFLIIWRLLDPLYKSLKDFPMIVIVNRDDEFKILPQLEICSCRKLGIWLSILYGMKGLILIFGLFLSYDTRKVFIKQINDSKLAGVAIYNIVILCAITIPMTILIVNNHNASFAFVAISLLASTFLSTVLIFFPKIFYIWKRKTDEETPDTLKGNLLSKDEENKYQQLSNENDEILKQISEKDAQIQRLSEMLKKKQMAK
ncbi:unnamed protein product [Gordionus sp. m RMFG-2023]|uniref:gamma-aminobutyric acid type B receptor subunit 1-like n=1 Tax=Gordionus sp. m RMFG-2023 TaxID=3053472 RepID=UPI0030E2B3D0